MEQEFMAPPLSPSCIKLRPCCDVQSDNTGVNVSDRVKLISRALCHSGTAAAEHDANLLPHHPTSAKLRGRGGASVSAETENEHLALFTSGTMTRQTGR